MGAVRECWVQKHTFAVGQSNHFLHSYQPIICFRWYSARLSKHCKNEMAAGIVIHQLVIVRPPWHRGFGIAGLSGLLDLSRKTLKAEMG